MKFEYSNGLMGVDVISLFVIFRFTDRGGASWLVPAFDAKFAQPSSAPVLLAPWQIAAMDKTVTSMQAVNART